MPSSNRVARTGIINELEQVLIFVEIIFLVYLLPQTSGIVVTGDQIRSDMTA